MSLGYVPLEELLMRVAQRVEEIAVATLAQGLSEHPPGEHPNKQPLLPEALRMMAILRRVHRDVERVQRAIHYTPTRWVDEWMDTREALADLPTALVSTPSGGRHREPVDLVQAGKLERRLSMLQRAIERNDASLLPEDMR